MEKRPYRPAPGDLPTGSRQTASLTKDNYGPDEWVKWDWREINDTEGGLLGDTPMRWPDIFQAVKSRQFSWDDLARHLSVDELRECALIVKGEVKRPPGYIPKAFSQACMKEILNRNSGRMNALSSKAIDVLETLMNDSSVKAETRAKIAATFIERVHGKTPEKIEVEHTIKPWEKLLGDGVAFEDDTIEGEVVAHVHDYSAREVETTTSEIGPASA